MISPTLIASSLMMSFWGADTQTDSTCRTEAWMWDQFKHSFVSIEGRVVDTGNGNISHSEGQGYALLMAEHFQDPDAFTRIWTWTKSHLKRDNDVFFSWKWQPAVPHIPDTNNASDGDVLIAWALLRAEQTWPNKGYKQEAEAIITALQQSHIKHVGEEVVLLPGSEGFVSNDRTVVNPGYWIYPAFDAFSKYSQQWSALSMSGLNILNKNVYGQPRLTSDWIQYQRDLWQPASQFPAHFSYSSYRVPLYLVWGSKYHLINENYVNWLSTANTAWVDVLSGENAPFPPPDGAFAIAELVELTRLGKHTTKGISVVPTGKDYYSDSLVLLSHIAYNERICR